MAVPTRRHDDVEQPGVPRLAAQPGVGFEQSCLVQPGREGIVRSEAPRLAGQGGEQRRRGQAPEPLQVEVDGDERRRLVVWLHLAEGLSQLAAHPALRFAGKSPTPESLALIQGMIDDYRSGRFMP